MTWVYSGHSEWERVHVLLLVKADDLKSAGYALRLVWPVDRRHIFWNFSREYLICVCVLKICLFKVHLFVCYAGVYFGGRLRSLSIDWLLTAGGGQNVPFTFQGINMYVMLFYHGPTLRAEANGSLCLHCVSDSKLGLDHVHALQLGQYNKDYHLLWYWARLRKEVHCDWSLVHSARCLKKAWFLLAKKTKMAYWLICSLKWVCIFVQITAKTKHYLSDNIVKWAFKEADCFWSQGSVRSLTALEKQWYGMQTKRCMKLDTGCRQNNVWSWIQDADRMMCEAGYRMRTEWCVKLDTGCRQNDVWSWIQDADRMMYEAGYRMQTERCMKLKVSAVNSGHSPPLSCCKWSTLQSGSHIIVFVIKYFICFLHWLDLFIRFRMAMEQLQYYLRLF